MNGLEARLGVGNEPHIHSHYLLLLLSILLSGQRHFVLDAANTVQFSYFMDLDGLAVSERRCHYYYITIMTMFLDPFISLKIYEGLGPGQIHKQTSADNASQPCKVKLQAQE